MTVCGRGKKQGLCFHVELVSHLDLRPAAGHASRRLSIAHDSAYLEYVANARNVRWRTSERAWQILLKAQTLILLVNT
jgi:hypothetical protein